MFELATINHALAFKVVALQFLTAAFLALYLLRKKFTDLNDVGEFLSRWGLWIGLIATAGAAAVTLTHEIVFNLPPCPFCWWQRIFLYPQIVLFGLAIYRNEPSVAGYSILLSIGGLLMALYHHVLQMFPGGGLPCPSEGVSCSQIFFLEFGYITYPLMAATLFAFLIVLMLFVRERR